MIAPVSTLPPVPFNSQISDFKSQIPAASGKTADLHKAAAQFEAILIRQLLAPALNSLSGGSALSAASGAPGGSGAGIYGYMITDILSQSISEGGGLGLARVIEQQLSPPPSKSQNTGDSA